MKDISLPNDSKTTCEKTVREKTLGGRLTKSSAGTIFSFAPVISQTIRASVSPIVLGGMLASSLFAAESFAQCTDSGSTVNCSGTISGQVTKSTSTSASASIVLSANASANIVSTPSNGHLFIMTSTGSGANAGDITFTQNSDGQDLAVTGDVAGLIYMNAQGTSGSADISVTLTGDISQANATGKAIFARGAGNTSITATDINASGTGIDVLAFGAVTISAGTISAGKDGIVITGSTSGDINVRATQVATSGSSNHAIKITSGGSNIDVRAGSIPTSGNGVELTNAGTGTITFSAGAFGTNSSTSRGVRIRTGSGAVNLNFSGALSADEPINISSTGTASITISSTSSISATSSGSDAIYVNAVNAAEVDITVKDVTAVKKAIHIRSLIGSVPGEYNVTVNGNITTTGSGELDHAIYWWRGLHAGSATFLVASGATIRASGGAGISTNSFPLGTLNSNTKETTVTISGNIYGERGGISFNPLASLTVITSGIISASRSISTSRGVVLNVGSTNSTSNTVTMTVNGGRIEGQYAAIQTLLGGSTTITINSGTISGEIYTRDGNDKLTLNSGSIGTSKLRGGTEDRSNQYVIDQDILVFNNSWSLGMSQIDDWENIYVNSGATVTITGSADIQTEDVHVSGTLSLSNSATTDHLTMIGLLNRARSSRRDTFLRGTGTIILDVNLGTGAADTITVNGNIVGNKTIKLNDITPAATTTRTNSEVTVITATETVVAENFKLENNNKFGSGGYVYTLNFKSASKSFVLRRSGRGTIQCIESTTATGSFSCKGAITNQETFPTNNELTVTIDSSATMNVSAGRVFYFNSYAAVTLTQEASGGTIAAGAQAIGIVRAYTRRSSYTVGNGLSITFTGSASFAGSGTAIHGRTTGAPNTISISIADLSATHASGNGLYIRGSGPSVTISTKAVTTGGNAISAKNVKTRNGTVIINTSGAITASGQAIYAYTRSGAITINTTSSVVGNPKAIEAKSNGGGNIELSISGDVSAGTQNGRIAINTLTNGSSSTIKIHSGTITAGGMAIQNDEGVSNVILYSGAVISGGINLGGGNDTLTMSGGTRGSSFIFSGGTNTGGGTENDNIVFNAGTTQWDATKYTLWEKITVGSGATLTFDGTSTLTGISLSLDGTASMKDDAVGDAITIGGGLSGPTASTGGILYIDVNFQTGTADTITVGGNLTGQHVLKVNNITPSNATVSTNPITVVTVTGTATANSLSLENAAILFSNRIFQLRFSSTNKTFNIISRPGATICTESSTSTGTFTCSGTINASEYMIKTTNDNITTTLDDSATVNVQSGIAFYLGGSGSLSFTQEASGNPITASNNAIGVVHANTTANENIAITLTNTASLTGSGTAIKATTSGTGNVTVSVANVTASNVAGAAIETSASGGNISISAGAIEGGKVGILAKNMGTSGAVTISVSQTITSSSGAGVDAYNNGNGNLEISVAGNISASTYGIKAESKNSGNISVNASGSIVNNSASDKQAILAQIKGATSSGNITIVAKDVTSSRDAVEAKHEGYGSISITVSGDILINTTQTGNRNAAIYAHNDSNGGDITINVQSGATASGDYAIYVSQEGSGDVTISAMGALTGSPNEGLWVHNEVGKNVSVTVHTVTGGKEGLSIVQDGTGSTNVSVMSGGSVTGKSTGILVSANSDGVISVVASGSVTGQEKDGVYVLQNDYSGSISIDVMATTGGEDGIDVRNTDSGGGNITVITRGVVTGSAIGITATHKGNRAGTVSVTTSAAVTGNSGAGIYAYGKNGSVSVSANDTVSGSADGIKVVNKHSGTSNASLRATAQVTGSGGNGIYVLNQSKGNISVNAGAVTGSTDGVRADNQGGGSIAITVSGNVKGKSSDQKAGIVAENDLEGLNISITAQSGTTIQGGYGIFAYNDGDGSVTITSSGQITGESEEGLYVYNVGTSTNVTVSSVTGKTNGIKVKHFGSDSAMLSVATGGSVSGEDQGIYFNGEGDGNISIIASGTITGSSGDGVYITQSGSGNLSLVAVAAVTGGEDGIEARKTGTGNLLIRTTSTVTAAASSDEDGIFAYKKGRGNISVTTAAVTGDDEGVDIRSYGRGTITALMNGAVTGSGSDETDAGVFVYSDTSGNALSLTVGNSGTVQGNFGILIDSRSNDTTTVNLSGAVTGNNQDGIEVNARSGNIVINVGANVTGADSKVGIDTYTAGGSTTINLTNGTVTAANGTAIRNDEGDSSITVRRGATIGSDVSLGGGADVLTFSGGTFASSAKLDGGEDSGNDSSIDILNFNSGSTTLNGGNITNWERITVGSTATIVSSGTNILAASQFNIAGTISMRNNAVNDILTLTGNVTGNSTLNVDANFSAGTVDTLNVRGNLTGQITINLSDATPSNLTTRTRDPITIVTVSGTATANSIVLFGGQSVGSRGYFYSLSFNALTKTYILTGEPGAKNCATTSGVNFICAGAITETENIVAYDSGNLTATLNGTATVNVTEGVAFNLFGQTNVTFTQSANGNSVNASSGATGVILAQTRGAGSISITLTGTATLSGSGTAILASSSGTGNISLQVAGVTASHSDGTAIRATGSGSSVSVRTNGAVTGGKVAIVVANTSAGSASVTTSGTVTSSGGNAIMASSSGNVTVNTSGNVTGNNFGIHAESTSTLFSNVQVSSNALVTGTTMAGIHARNMSNGSLSVSASGVTGQTHGIVALHTGTGAITVNTSGPVSGVTEYGLHVSNRATGNNITVSATSTVNGAKGGILVMNNGVGRVEVNTSNTVSSSAAGRHGISVNHSGTGNVTVNVSGTVTGGTNGTGIHAQASSGTVTIVLNSGAIVGSAGGMAIMNGAGNSSVTINSGATLSGSLKLGAGRDSLTVTGGNLGTSELDGGTDSGTDRSEDVLTFASGSSSLSANRLLNWEKIVVASGATLSTTQSITIETNDFDLKGTLSLQDRQANDVFTIDGNLAGGGTIKIDVDFSQTLADRISVSGNASGATKIEITDITPAASVSRVEQIIIASVNGNSSASTFSLAGNPQILSAGYIYTLDFDSQSKTYQLRGNSIVGSLLLATPVAIFDGFAKAPSLHQRLGGVMYHSSDEGNKSRYWTRTFSRNNDYSGSNFDKLSHENSVVGFQFGADTIIQDNEYGQWIIGANVSNYQVESTITVDTNVGNMEATGFGVGGTATWYSKDGSFIDIQGQLIRVTASVDSELLPDLIDDDRSTALYVSAEYGHLFLNLNDIKLFGIAQLSLGDVGLGQANTSAGVLKLDVDGGLTLRTGVMAEFEQDNVSWYAIANVISESADEWSVYFAGETFTDKTSALFAELNAGVSSEIATNVGLFAQGNFITSIDGHDNSKSSFGISAGIKYSW